MTITISHTMWEITMCWQFIIIHLLISPFNWQIQWKPLENPCIFPRSRWEILYFSVFFSLKSTLQCPEEILHQLGYLGYLEVRKKNMGWLPSINWWFGFRWPIHSIISIQYYGFSIGFTMISMKFLWNLRLFFQPPDPWQPMAQWLFSTHCWGFGGPRPRGALAGALLRRGRYPWLVLGSIDT